MEFKNIVYEKDKEKGIVKLTINRPEVRNALNAATRQEIRNAIGEIEKDGDVRVVIITGAGEKAFISGADITAFKDATPITMEESASTLGQQLFSDIENISVPVIAMINGFCLGGGQELAMCCDIRIASENAKFGQPEVNVGILPGGGGTQRLPRLVGWGKAKELIYTGKIIDATEAEKIGLVDKVVPLEKLEEEVNQLAETIASKSPLIIKLIKKTINKGMYTDLAAGLAYEKANFALCFATEDHKEGVTAFLEKRKPEFKGR
ncbi:MAG: crotonase [Chloroflexi bacterium]|nr:MAG: crotonase [Chloroflexota bacterium]